MLLLLLPLILLLLLLLLLLLMLTSPQGSPSRITAACSALYHLADYIIDSAAAAAAAAAAPAVVAPHAVVPWLFGFIHKEHDIPPPTSPLSSIACM